MQTHTIHSSCHSLTMLSRISLVFLLLTSFVRATDAVWENAADGDWFDAANWENNDSPDGRNALINQTGADYTVWVTNQVADTVHGLTLQNSSTHTATLVVTNGGLNHADGVVTLGQGAVAELREGGSWHYDGTHTQGGTTLFSIQDGAELTISGGEMVLTNMQSTVSGRKSFSVGYGSTGVVNVTSGRLDLQMVRTATDDDLLMYVGIRDASNVPGSGELNITGGEVIVGSSQPGGYALGIGMRDSYGRVEVADGGSLTFAGPTWNALVVGASYSAYGELIVGPGGSVNMQGNASRLWVSHIVNSTGLVHVAGGELLTQSANVAWRSQGLNNREHTGRLWISDGLFRAPYGVTLSSLEQHNTSRARSAFDINGGIVEIGYLMAAYSKTDPTKTVYSNNFETVVTMTDGVMTVNGGFVSTTDPNEYRQIVGIGLGMIGHNGIHNADDSGCAVLGQLNLSGGVITNQGNFVMGVSGGTGIVHQAGGTLTHVPGAANRYTIIGYAAGSTPEGLGGIGEYSMSGGSYTTPNLTFVGGVPTNNISYSVSGSQGLLDVTGGSFSVDNTLYVGGHGTGTLRLGDAGSVTAKNLKLASGEATLAFAFGSSGLATLGVVEDFEVQDEARLEIDLTDYDPALGERFKLVSCDSRTGSFKAENITIDGNAAAYVDQSEDDLWLVIPMGTLILVR